MEENKARISVIIPTRGRRAYLQDVLADLAKQSLEIYEVIAPDQSYEFEPLVGDYPFNLKHFHHSGIGPCSSRNEGIDLSSGEILVFLDDDIRIEENFVSELTLDLRNGKCQVSTGAICDREGAYKAMTKKPMMLEHELSWLIPMTNSPGHSKTQYTLSIPGCCFAVWKRVLVQAGKFDTFFDPDGAGEDRELAVRLVREGNGISYNGGARIMHLSAQSGGRRTVNDSPFSFQVNIGYILLKHFGREEFDLYWRRIIRWRLRKIMNLRSVRTDLALLRRFRGERKRVLGAINR